jgi:hypothetical protein
MEFNKGYSNTFINFQNNSFYFRENKNLVFVQLFMDHIIAIKNDRSIPLIDFKGKSVLTIEEIKKVTEEKDLNKRSMYNVMQLNKYYNITSFIEKDDLILFDIFKGMSLCKILIQKSTNRVSFFTYIQDDLLFGENSNYAISIPEFGCIDGDGVYYFASNSEIAHEFGTLAKDGVLSPDIHGLEDLKKFEEEDNPILFYYEFKN